jgi:DNA polymerase V
MRLEVYVPKTPVNPIAYLPIPIPAGPAAAVEQEPEWIDIEQFLREGRDHVLYVRAYGLSMKSKDENRIDDGDLLVVHRTGAAEPGDVVIAEVNGEFTIKRLKRHSHGLYLVPANDAYPIRRVDRSDDFRVWAVVTHNIHRFRRLAA